MKASSLDASSVNLPPPPILQHPFPNHMQLVRGGQEQGTSNLRPMMMTPSPSCREGAGAGTDLGRISCHRSCSDFKTGTTMSGPEDRFHYREMSRT